MASSLKYFASRLVISIVVLFLVIFIISAILSIEDYDAARTEIRNGVIKDTEENQEDLMNMSFEERKEWKEEKIAHHREKQGAKNSILVNSMKKSWRGLRGKFGEAYYMSSFGASRSEKVMDIIKSSLPYSILLYSLSTLAYILLGMFFGIRSAKGEHEKYDKFYSVTSMTFASIPMWWLGMIALMIFGYRLNWFPTSAFPLPDYTGLKYYGALLYRMLLPFLIIVLTMFGGRAWTTRRLIEDELEKKYVIGARTKGIPEKKIIYSHTLRSASPAIISNSMRFFLYSLPALIITEAIFGWPGIGRVYYLAVRALDYPVIIGLAYIYAILYIGIWLIADIVNGILDPRLEA